MKLQAFSIYDYKAECHQTPFFMHKAGMAMRAFANLARDPQSQVSHNPSDYDLYHIGEWDDETSSLVPLTPLVRLSRASELIQPEENINEISNDQQVRQGTGG